MEYSPASFSSIKTFDLQRSMVAHMTSKSWQTIPHVAYSYEPDITEFYDAYQSVARDLLGQGLRVSFNTIILKTIVEGLKAAPEMNAHLQYDFFRGVGELKISEAIHLAIAWTLPDDRMITPVLFDAGSMDLRQLCRAMTRMEQRIEKTNIDELIYQAVKNDTLQEIRGFNPRIVQRLLAHIGQRNGLHAQAKREYYKIPENERLTADDLLGATVTISNVGSLYKNMRGFFNVLEIIPPQVAAIGIGAAQEKPGIYQGGDAKLSIGVRKMLPINLVFDHRALDFKAIVPFIQRLDEIFAHPRQMENW